MGKSTISTGSLSIAMLNYQRVKYPLKLGETTPTKKQTHRHTHTHIILLVFVGYECPNKIFAYACHDCWSYDSIPSLYPFFVDIMLVKCPISWRNHIVRLPQPGLSKYWVPLFFAESAVAFLFYPSSQWNTSIDGIDKFDRVIMKILREKLSVMRYPLVN